MLTEKAAADAIKVFSQNLKELLLQPPVKGKTALGLDPGYRTGCKVAVVNATGRVLDTGVAYITHSEAKQREAKELIKKLILRYGVEIIAIGNGTASRETEELMKKVPLPQDCKVWTVSEDGASIYSASEVARKEFPDEDVTVRGAVSIGRRLMDPLAELVKIDPKNLGIGQYQHDVNQTLLHNSLEDVVISCVNSVGVELNTASKELLSYVSGIGPALARNIVDYRYSEGPFRSRKELLKVDRLGEKAFEQCAGFLRVRESDNPLDRSAVHPERYALVEKMAKAVGTDVEGLMKDKGLRSKIDINQFVDPSQNVGLPTLQDIMKELDKPGLDPRTKFEVFEFDPNVQKVEDLQEGMILPGIVTNITAFGAFVDVGVHQDGLVHISQMANRRVNDPNEVVKLHQHVRVKVIEVDLNRHRISLSMKNL